MKKSFMSNWIMLLAIISISYSTKVVQASGNLHIKQINTIVNSSGLENDINQTSLGMEEIAKETENEALRVEEIAKETENEALRVEEEAKETENEALRVEEEAKETENEALETEGDTQGVEVETSEDIRTQKLQEYKDMVYTKYNYYNELMNRSITKRETIIRYQKNINNLEKEGKLTITKYKKYNDYYILDDTYLAQLDDIDKVKLIYKEIKNAILSLEKELDSYKETKAKLIERYSELKAIIKEQKRIASLPKTLQIVETYDYVTNSITGLSNNLVSVASLNKKLKSYGKLLGTGLPYEEYQEAMEYKWLDKTDYKNPPVNININLNNTINYNTYVSTLKKLSRYDGVYLYQIGVSGEGRPIYAIEVNFNSKQNKEVIMLTGQSHAREFAGGSFILKELVDLVQKAQSDATIKRMLQRTKYVAVPIINVDGRENLIHNPLKWTQNGQLWKAYSNGTDGNRNFPGLSWGLLANGTKKNASVRSQASSAFYPGPYGGSSSETKALMKWIYHYVVIDKANTLIDYHQQGSIVFAGKPWTSKTQENTNHSFRQRLLNFLNRGNYNRRYLKYAESNGYGLDGVGSTLTDYATGIALGSKFSPAYGFHVFTDGMKEYTLLEVKDLDTSKVKFTGQNTNFKTITLEIGYGVQYLGNSISTRQKLSKEYKQYHFDTLLERLPSLLK